MENTTQDNQDPSKQAKEPVFAVGVQFRPAGKIYTFEARDDSLKMGNPVMVEGESGRALAFVIVEPHTPKEGELAPNAKKILHAATEEEIKIEMDRREKALGFFSLCAKKIAEHNLQMKLVDVQLEEEGKKAVFVFYAEQRVDFRALVKDLAQAIHLRIEMRQVGARDESKYKGCLGPCGLNTCCSLYLRQFQSISISLAKHQGLAPNPAKLTGMCGKLKCCLAYEHEVYNEYRKDLPKVGTAVSCEQGAGKISGHNILKRECTVRLFGGGEHRCPCSSVKPLTPEEREAAQASVKKAEDHEEERIRRRNKQRESSGRNRKK